MNYFAHAHGLLGDPYFVAGTAVPDWLSVVDRRMRVRSKTAQQFLDDEDERVAALAEGIVRHHHDDRWFHQTRAFAELNLQLTVLVREQLPEDDGFRPSFLGHILVEILLDAVLAARHPDRLERYYQQIESLDAAFVAGAVNRMSTRQSERLALFIPRFCSERFLYDYQDDAKLFRRLNMVMRRVKMPLLSERLLTILPESRQRVAARHEELLAGYSTQR